MPTKIVIGFVVALRKESVDRKKRLGLPGWLRVLSLSARRAWIEKTTYFDTSSMDDVALRKESVDRKAIGPLIFSVQPRSLSARRAWIEKLIFAFWTAPSRRRSPQGERG